MATIQEVLEAFCGVPGPPLPRKARGGLSAELGPNGTYLLKAGSMQTSTTICIRYGEYILFRTCVTDRRLCGYLTRLRSLVVAAAGEALPPVPFTYLRISRWPRDLLDPEPRDIETIWCGGANTVEF